MHILEKKNQKNHTHKIKLTQQRGGPAEPDADRADQRGLARAVGPDDEVERRPGAEVDGVAVGLFFLFFRWERKRRSRERVSVFFENERTR